MRTYVVKIMIVLSVMFYTHNEYISAEAENINGVVPYEHIDQTHYESVIREDLTWEYLVHRWTFDHHSYELQHTGFDGTVEINGTVWHKYVLKESEMWVGVADSHDCENPDYGSLEVCYKGITSGQNRLLGLIREENGKVYLYKTEEELGNINGYTTDSRSQNELLLYDFTTASGDRNIRYISFGRNNEIEWLSETETQTVESVNVAGKSLRKITESVIAEYTSADLDCDIYTIEGIGNVGCGDFLSYSYEGRYRTTGYVDEFRYFSRLFDEDGKVIYESGKYPTELASVNEIASEINVGPMYDVMGREIKNPAPGSIYIQDGRKYIAR